MVLFTYNVKRSKIQLPKTVTLTVHANKAWVQSNTCLGMEKDEYEQFGDEGKKHKWLMKLADDLCKESKEKVTSEQLFGNWKELPVGSYVTPTSYRKNRNSFTSWAWSVVPEDWKFLLLRKIANHLIFHLFLSKIRLSTIILNQPKTLFKPNSNNKTKISLTWHLLITII